MRDERKGERGERGEEGRIRSSLLHIHIYFPAPPTFLIVARSGESVPMSHVLASPWHCSIISLSELCDSGKKVEVYVQILLKFVAIGKDRVVKHTTDGFTTTL